MNVIYISSIEKYCFCCKKRENKGIFTLIKDSRRKKG